MSFYLTNPGGRVVALDDEKAYKKWLSTPGFKEATNPQIKSHIKAKQDEYKARLLAKTGGELDVYIATVSSGGRDGFGVASEKIMQELKHLDVNIERASKNQRIGFLFHNPYSIMRLENQFRILFTMFESTKLPDDWKDYLEAADMVLVPSKWCAEVFEKMGVKTEVIPLGYDASTYKFVPRRPTTKTRKNFNFLHYNAFNIRKGFLEVFKAFVKEFDPAEPVRMIFKTTLKKPPLPITKSKYPNIQIEHGNYTEGRMMELMERSHCFVFPSRGEGFGMTPLEAMATGMPAIVPNAHGISEYFNDKYMYEVEVAEECPALYSRYKNQDVGKMVVCDVDHLAKQMRYVYEHQTEAFKKGKEASEYVKQYTFENTAKKLKTIFKKINAMELKDKPLRNILELEKVVSK